MSRRLRPLFVFFVVLALTAASCADADDASSPSPDDTVVEIEIGADRGGGVVDLAADLAAAEFEVSAGVETLTVTGADPAARLSLLDEGGARIVTGPADDLGQLHVAYVPTNYLETETSMKDGLPTTDGGSLDVATYRVYAEDADPPQVSEPIEPLARDDAPEALFFEGKDLLAECPDMAETRNCYTYIEMRDGVTLSATVRWPDAALYGEPPYPTLIEYSGYGPSNPAGNGEPGSMISGLIGFATVGINMRGSGCSGGVFDTFNPAQQADGYDVIETVAREDWVLNNKPGMVGLSYSGIGQLFRGIDPAPSLAAIAPLSVIEDPWLMQWPGGIYNSGFTKNWLEERDRQNAPGGDSWITERIDGGDEICKANLALHEQNPDFEAFVHALEFRPEDSDSRRLALLVQDIDVPVYLTGAWQDEQTGAKFATMLDHFTNTDKERFILFNGHHPDGYSPMVITDWYEFLSFYVARRTPDLPDIVQAASPPVFEENFGIRVGFGEDRFEGMPYEEALAEYEAEPKVRVLFESGWGLPDVPGGVQETFEAAFEEWPPPNAEALQWYLAADAALADTAPEDGTVEQYRHDPDAGDVRYVEAGSSDFQFPEVPFDWPATAEGDAVVHVSEPFADDTVIAGPGYATLWVRPEVDDATVEVTLSEVRADGVEYRIQGGWLRLGHQVADEELSGAFLIEPTYAQDDFQPLVPGEWVEVKVPIYPFAHPMRAGSRLAMRVDTPGRDLPFWAFENPEYDGEVHHTIGVGGQHASSLTIMDLPEVEFPAEAIASPPPCPALRGQVCRPWEDYENVPAD